MMQVSCIRDNEVKVALLISPYTVYCNVSHSFSGHKLLHTATTGYDLQIAAAGFHTEGEGGWNTPPPPPPNPEI